ncbi:MAG: phospho-N-acetylmuramoyl-pentapeptide-transferase [Candidatus Omnitrophota bacterium]|jgi:phospho-N-acetylmuramoyl-pentapeptide-transferase
MASMTAFAVCLILGPVIIKWLKSKDASHNHSRVGFGAISDKSQHKAHVPTMGGLLITLSIVIANLIWADLGNQYLWIALIGMIALGLIGYLDDRLKLNSRSSKGLPGNVKILGQTIIVVVLVMYMAHLNNTWSIIQIPFFKDLSLDIGWLYFPFAWLVIVGASNAVNLTDGLDGLAIGCSIFVSLTFGVVAYLTGHIIFAEYLYLPYIAPSGELTVFCASIMGAGLGFLWFNAHPAEIFMGDTGSLSIGGALGIVALLIKKEFLLALVGGIFAVEAISVILQVLSFKLTGKRIFLMAPLHHHFQMKGMVESKIVIRFWIISIILTLAGLATLKLR